MGRCCRSLTRLNACSNTPRRCRPKKCRWPMPTVAFLPFDLKALRTQPPADVSAMDGYAVRADDVARRAGAPESHRRGRRRAAVRAASAPAKQRASSPAA